MSAEQPNSFHARPLLAATLLCVAAGNARAELGLDLSGSIATESTERPFTVLEVDWQRITATPWWESEGWRLAAELPLVSRDAELVSRSTGRVLAAESDAGLGDVRLRATHSWLSESVVTPSAGIWLKLPTGDENAGTLTGPTTLFSPTRQGQYSLGTGSTDLGVHVGIDAVGKWAWGAAEISAITVLEQGPALQEDRPAGYLGLGLTPVRFLEFSVEFDYEGELTAGGGELEQTTYAVALKPDENFAITLSTYADNQATTPDSNWTLGAAARW